DGIVAIASQMIGDRLSLQRRRIIAETERREDIDVGKRAVAIDVLAAPAAKCRQHRALTVEHENAERRRNIRELIRGVAIIIDRERKATAIEPGANRPHRLVGRDAHYDVALAIIYPTA